MEENRLTCCLCSYVSHSEFDLETHIDYNHADIFRLSNEDQATTQSLQIKTESLSYTDQSPLASEPPIEKVGRGRKKLKPKDHQVTEENAYSSRSHEMVPHSYPRNEAEHKRRSISKDLQKNGKKRKQELVDNSELDDLRQKLNESLAENEILLQNVSRLQMELSQSQCDTRAMTEKLASFDNILEAKGLLADELTSSKKLVKELKNDLKVKTTERNTLRIQLGRYKSSVDQVQSKLLSINKKYCALKEDSNHYQIVKVAMMTVLENDNVFSHLNAKNCISGLDDQELCYMIRDFIIESFDAKVDHYNSMIYANDKLIKNNEELLRRKQVIEHQSANLILQTKTVENQLKTIGEMKKIESQLQSRIAMQKEEHQKLDSKYSQTLNVATSFRTELAELENMFTASQEENCQLKKQDEKSVSMISQLKSALIEAKQLLLSLEEQNIEFKKLCEHYERKKIELTSELQAQKHKVISLEKENAQIRETAEMSKAKANKIKSELFEIEKLYETLQETGKVKSQQLLQCESKLGEMEKVLKHYKEQVSSLQDEQKQAMTLKEEIITDLKNEIQDLQNIHNQSHDKFTKMEKKYNQQGVEYVKIIQNHNDSLKSMKSEVGSIMAEKEKQIVELQLELKSKESLLCVSKSSLDNKTLKIEELKNKILKLVETITAFKTKAQEQLTIYKNFEKVTANDKKEIKQSKKIMESLRKEVDSSKELADFLKGELDTSEEAKENLQAKLQSAKDSNDNLKKELDSSQDLLWEARKEHESAKELGDTLQRDLISSKDKIETLTNKLSASQSQVTKLKDELKQVKVETNKLKKELASKQKLNSIKPEMSVDNEWKDEVKATVKKELLDKEDELRILKKETYKKHVQIRTLEEEVINCQEKVATLEKERQKSIDDMTWANKYCVNMDKRIKKLEAQLSMYQPQQSIDSGESSTLTDSWQPCIKEEPNTKAIKQEVEESKIVKLKIRRSNP